MSRPKRGNLSLIRIIATFPPFFIHRSCHAIESLIATTIWQASRHNRWLSCGANRSSVYILMDIRRKLELISNCITIGTVGNCTWVRVLLKIANGRLTNQKVYEQRTRCRSSDFDGTVLSPLLVSWSATAHTLDVRVLYSDTIYYHLAHFLRTDWLTEHWSAGWLAGCCSLMYVSYLLISIKCILR